MNDKIKELYIKARNLPMSTDDFVLDEWEEKFAKLIIDECLMIAAPIEGSGDAADLASEEICECIKEHFDIQ
jgi:hypothetical protein